MSKSRNEVLLEKLLSGDTANIEPHSRVEELLLALTNGEKTDSVPRSRIEAYLKALGERGLGGGGGVTVPIITINYEFNTSGDATRGHHYIIYMTIEDNILKSVQIDHPTNGTIDVVVGSFIEVMGTAMDSDPGISVSWASEYHIPTIPYDYSMSDLLIPIYSDNNGDSLIVDVDYGFGW